jgi:hypothetical protein
MTIIIVMYRGIIIVYLEVGTYYIDVYVMVVGYMLHNYQVVYIIKVPTFSVLLFMAWFTKKLFTIEKHV